MRTTRYKYVMTLIKHNRYDFSTWDWLIKRNEKQFKRNMQSIDFMTASRAKYKQNKNKGGRR